MFKTGIYPLQEGIQVMVTTSCLLINCLNLIKSRELRVAVYFVGLVGHAIWSQQVSRFPVVKVHGRNQYMVTVPEFT